MASLVAVLSLTPGAANAWKPTTHAYFADLAVQDALDDGAVTIPILGTTDTVTLQVDPLAMQALIIARRQYRAGVLGPDAYPDVLTGQQVIHPDGRETGVPGGSDQWLSHVWRTFNQTPQQRAFRLGFLTHAAGDAYGHTFINHFTGGPFSLVPPDNAIKHIVLEGYVDKRLPAQQLGGDFFNASIDGVGDAIYTNMINARPGTHLGAVLLPSTRATVLSVPKVFSVIRTGLDNNIAAYYARKADLQRRAETCAPLDFSCSRVALTAELAAHVTANGPAVTYIEHWRDDVDDGLKAWPGVSHEVALALFFNSERKADVQRAERALTAYAQNHLLSMAGAPDFVGLTAAKIAEITEAVTPDFLLEPIKQLKQDALDALMKSAIGMTKSQLQDYLARPDRYFDQVMGTGSGQRITLRDFNREHLKISDAGYQQPSQAFDYRDLPAAYNTVVASKLVLVSPSEINRLIRELGGGRTLGASSNVMLGFVRTLDGSMQWRGGMVMTECAVYAKVFKPLPGEPACSAGASPR